MNIPVFVINLKRSVERRNHVINHLKNLGVEFQIVEGIDGEDLSEQEIRNDHRVGVWKDGSRTRFMRRGEIGCVLSHLKIYQKMIESNLEIACVLEDDMECSKEIKEFLVYENLNIVDWDLLYLGHHSQFSKKETWCINKRKLGLENYQIGEPIELPGGSYGYIIKKEAAATILKYVYPIRMSHDHYIGNASALGIRTYVLSPPCIYHNYLFESTVTQNSEVLYTQSLIENIRKLIRKTYKWFPFLKVIRIRINCRINQSVILLRKIKLLGKLYAKFN